MLFSSPSELPASEYDFVIIGAGIGGCVLANRLTENASVRVLLIEAGGSDFEGNQSAVIPFLGVTLPGSELDWKYSSVSQPALNGRSIQYPRGRVLGGSSIINLLTWNRGSKDMWDKWASITDDSGWSWESVEKYYKKTSTLVEPADKHDTAGQCVSSAHGEGPVKVSVPGWRTEIDDYVINASKELGGRFIYNEDLNAGNTVGFSYMQSTVGEGKRSSAASAYLNPAIHRPNLDVLVSTQVTKLISQQKRDGDLIVFDTVEVAQESSGPRYKVKATKEILLCAGAIGTPQILLLSGIGPKDSLESKGIESIIDNPDVGQHFTDHVLVPSYYYVNTHNTYDSLLRNPALFGEAMQEWITAGQGPLVISPGNTQAYLRLPPSSPIFKKFADPASGPLSAHTEIIFVHGFAPFGGMPPPSEGNFMTLLSVVVSPLSRGSVKLASEDPFHHPLIDPGFFSNEFDKFAIVQTMKDADEFLEASTWKNFIKGPYGDLANAITDEAKAEYAKKYSTNQNHPAGSARMSPDNADWGVVDSKLQVKGASRLRVVDASIFPTIPECHIQSSVYTIAERAAALIKGKHGLV